VHVVGARPNYMKVAPVYAELERRGPVEQRSSTPASTYDREVNDVFFEELPLPSRTPAARRLGSHAEQTARALVELERLFWSCARRSCRPGDVNSTLARGAGGGEAQHPVCHLESGLRSFDRRCRRSTTAGSPTTSRRCC
jgi:UDP-N-acetylglucosamine 2-epimerase (non-hydrolysing)